MTGLRSKPPTRAGRPALAASAALALLATIAPLASIRAAAPTERVSVDATGGDADGWSDMPSITADGRYVAFMSYGSDLVAGDTNSQGDVFLRDRQNGTTELVSVDSNEVQGNGWSFQPFVSSDGRYVAFTSDATNLVSGDGNGTRDVFIRDRQTGTTERVSQDPSGSEFVSDSDAGSITPDGRYVAYESVVAGEFQVFRYDRTIDSTVLVSVSSDEVPGDGSSRFPGMTPDGRYIAFTSYAADLTNVVDDPGGSSDIFLRDLDDGTTEQISLDANGGDLGAESDVELRVPISDDGRYVAFHSGADEIVAGGNTPYLHVAVRDRQTGTNEIVSVNDLGATGDSFSEAPAMSSDGRYVAFFSSADNLVANDTNGSYDVFVRDRIGGTTVRASLDSSNEQSSGYKYRAALSADGAFVAFLATDALVPNDTNGFEDIYVRDPSAPSVPAPESASGNVGPGGSVSTGGGVASVGDPIDTTVTSPTGGTISIVEAAPLGAPPPAGYTFLGQQVTITAPPASVAAPLVIAFTVDSSVLGGTDETTLQLFRNGVPIASCGGATAADPDPCIGGRERLADGDVRLTARTSAASVWSVGLRSPYAFTGFLQPVDDLPTLNRVKAGASIPVKFRLGGNQGMAVMAGGYPRSAPITCQANTPVDAIEQTVTSGSSSLQFDASSGTYTYVWKTDKGWAGSCRQLVVRLADGSAHRASVQFTK